MSGFHDWNKVSGIQAEEWNVQRDGTGVQDKLSACLPVFLLILALLPYAIETSGRQSKYVSLYLSSCALYSERCKHRPFVGPTRGRQEGPPKRLVSSLLEYSLPPILVQSIVLRRLIF
jgi:hypothetical protein